MRKNRTKIIIILLCIAGALYALYPTYRSQDMKSDLDSFSNTPSDSVKRVSWLAANGQDLKDVNAKAIKLGLDLRGGIYVTMEVDVLKFIDEQALQKDDIFQAVENARAGRMAEAVDRRVVQGDDGDRLCNGYCLPDDDRSCDNP